MNNLLSISGAHIEHRLGKSRKLDDCRKQVMALDDPIWFANSWPTFRFQVVAMSWSGRRLVLNTKQKPGRCSPNRNEKIQLR
jgi:hypothetical protein